MSQGYRVYNPSGLSVTLTGKAGGLGAKTGLYIQKGPQQFSTGDGIAYCIDKNYHKGIAPSQVGKGRRTQVIDNTVSKKVGTKKTINPDNIRIRRLTPKECWRLQGFPDRLFNKVKQTGVSDAQLYKMSGNAVTVNVIEAIGKRLKEIE